MACKMLKPIAVLAFYEAWPIAIFQSFDAARADRAVARVTQINAAKVDKNNC